MVFSHSQDLAHFIYTICIGFYVELLLAQRGLCRLMNFSLTWSSHPCSKADRGLLLRAAVWATMLLLGKIDKLHGEWVSCSQTPCSFPFATITMLALFSNKNNRQAKSHKTKPNKFSFSLESFLTLFYSNLSKKIAVDIF